MKRFIAIFLAQLIAVTAFCQNVKQFDKDSLDKKMEELRIEYGIPGMCVAVMKGNDVVYTGAFGVRDIESGEPIEITDIFRIASTSKTFTGAAVMQLVEQGKIKLDDDINKYLKVKIRNPRYPKDKITIRMILSHTSSILDGRNRNSLDPVNPKMNPKDSLMQFFGDWRPGEKYTYSNRGTNIAGTIVETVSGERFDEYVKHHLLEPLGIKNASFNIDSVPAERLVSQYFFRKNGTPYVSEDAHDRAPAAALLPDKYRFGYDTPGFCPAGGMKISIEELIQWAAMYKNGGVGTNGTRILTKASIDTMTTRQLSAPAYGLTMQLTKKNHSFGHGGRAYGVLGHTQVYPDRDLAICVYTTGHLRGDNNLALKLRDIIAKFF